MALARWKEQIWYRELNEAVRAEQSWPWENSAAQGSRKFLNGDSEEFIACG